MLGGAVSRTYVVAAARVAGSQCVVLAGVVYSADSRCGGESIAVDLEDPGTPGIYVRTLTSDTESGNTRYSRENARTGKLTVGAVS
jgi:hypothetical protein